MSLKAILSVMGARFDRIRSGVDVGFDDAAVSSELRALRGGTWMTVVTDEFAQAACTDRLEPGTVLRLGADDALPFEGSQFEVVVLDGRRLSPELVREVHRVLRPSGCLFFSVEETVRRGPGNTLSRLYNVFLKNGFDIVAVSRPGWWRFGSRGHALTVCASKKNWRETKKGLRFW